ncbi:hypothetical protein C4568_03425 [Candidatus Parcubacteria bacterium]|nr:MAG: hypothetical protein C4568_03425 [Candidatus Parcubacteria bacterium]
MNFDEYQKLASRTATFSGKQAEIPLVYVALGLAGESGELIEKIKKVMRNDNGEISEEKREEIKREIGDVLWYLSQISRLCDIPFDDAAVTNIEKLADRAKRGVIKSEGDTR